MAYPSAKKNAEGKRTVTFNPKEGWTDRPTIPIKCGQCPGCQMARSKEWAIRCIHEAQMHYENCFITLTYREEDVPRCGSLIKKHFQDFMKRLRKNSGVKMRYFHCGEYGEKRGRPHYHALLFGYRPEDLALAFEGAEGPVYTSPFLEKTWGKGFVTVGEVNFKSAAYVARYVLKKAFGAQAHKEYEFLQPEYVTMSRRPGIGARWLECFRSDVFPHDYVVAEGYKNPTPRFYSNLLKAVDPAMFEDVRAQRVEKSKEYFEKMSLDRLRVCEKVQLLTNKQLKRSYEDGSSEYTSEGGSDL